MELLLKDVALIFSDVREELADFSLAQSQLQRWKDEYPQVRHSARCGGPAACEGSECAGQL